MLKIVSLGCERDDSVLFEKVSFLLSPGDTLHIQGHNGVGKTTLLRSIAGLFHNYQGDIFWADRLLQKNYVDFCLNSYFLGHRPALKGELTPTENMRLSHQLSGRSLAIKIEDALDQANLRGYEHTPCYQLSSGQRQRVSLSGLLMSNACLWILDEPFTAIDADGVQWVEGLIEAHAQQGGMTIVTSHQPLSNGITYVKILELERNINPQYGFYNQHKNRRELAHYEML
ncbi:MAG: cytochrome c biogenesis heme-transporting ATPase CcmA [Endozoicomonas sp. (ex Botrylloides leachii)]|nr:cytochrome c biogenesis heme-transporting ATPase CcmA [Endozoicomonas sp. (ex Botrylloides leachii)]